MEARTTRERREARAERLRGWSEGREAKANAAFNASHDATAGIPFGQPILVGHHSERRHRAAVERGQRQATAAIEHSDKASDMLSRAENIEAANANAIYSDDHDARERLAGKIASLEAERERIKVYNASCRKAHKTGGTGDLSILDEQQKAQLLSTAKACPYQIRDGAAAPSYWITNLGGNISRLKKRLAALPAEGEKAPGRWMDARFSSDCAECGQAMEKGSRILYVKLERAAYCDTCGGERS